MIFIWNTLGDKEAEHYAQKHRKNAIKFPLIGQIIRSSILTIYTVRSAAALSVRLIFRRNLRHDTIHIIPFVLTIGWMRGFVGYYPYIEPKDVGIFHYILGWFDGFLYYPFWFITSIFQFGLLSYRPWENPFMLYTLVAMGIGTLYIIRKHVGEYSTYIDNKVFDPLIKTDYRGKSVAFGWIKEIHPNLQLILDTLLIFGIGYLCYTVGRDAYFGIFLMASSIALFWEDRQFSKYKVISTRNHPEEVRTRSLEADTDLPDQPIIPL